MTCPRPDCIRRREPGWAMCRDHVVRAVLDAFGSREDSRPVTPQALGANAASGVLAGATPEARKG